MPRKHNPSRIWLCAWMEYRQWLHGPRMILLPVLFVYIYSTVMVPLFRAAKRLHAAVGWFEPYIAMCNNGLLTLLFPLLFLVLIADFPRMEPDAMFRIFRTGRWRWLVGQALMLCMAAVTLVAATFLLCTALALLLGAKVDFVWGEAIRAMVAQDIAPTASLIDYLPTNLFYQVRMHEALLLSSGLLVCNCIAMGSVMLALSLFHLKRFATVLCAGAVAAGSMLMGARSQLQWLLPTSHFTLRVHFTEYFSRPEMPLWVSFTYFGVITLLALGVAAWKVGSYHFIIGQEAGL